jgi:methionine synthase I (cobalamin-dependent)
MQSNAGQPEIAGEEITYKYPVEEFAEGLSILAREGADIVGGCCGSTPEMMVLAKAKVKEKGNILKLS